MTYSLACHGGGVHQEGTSFPSSRHLVPVSERALLLKSHHFQMKEEHMAIGPIQYIVFGVRTEDQQKELVQRMRAISERGNVRLIDLAYIRKAEDGSLQQGHMSGLSEEEQRKFGTVARALIGMGAAVEYCQDRRRVRQWRVRRSGLRRVGAGDQGAHLRGRAGSATRRRLRDRAGRASLAAGVEGEGTG